MKVKRYRAENTQQAMAMVRAELGKDAVLISNKRVAGQVEVLAASDFDPQEVKQKYERLTAANAAPRSQPLKSKETATRVKKVPAKRSANDLPFELLADLGVEREKEFKQEKEIRRQKEKEIAREKRRLLKKEKEVAEEKARRLQKEREVAEEKERRMQKEREIAKEKERRLQKEREIVEEKEKRLQREQEILAQSESLQEMHEELGRLRKLFEGEMAQLVWRDSHNRQPNRVALLSRLEMVGINHDLASQLVDKVLPCDDVELGWEQIVRLLPRALKRPAPDPLQDGGIIAMVGSTGVGKTTTAVKMAASYAKQHGRNQVALITTDDFRAGQREQVLSLGSSLGLSVQVAADNQEMQQALECFAERKLLIIDTAGINHRRQDFKEQFATVLNHDRKVDPYLVLSATVQESVINETIRGCADLNPVAAIVTKTDENASIGAVLSALIRHRLPVSYLGTGQSIPDDLVCAETEFFVERIADSYQQALAYMQKRRKKTA